MRVVSAMVGAMTVMATVIGMVRMMMVMLTLITLMRLMMVMVVRPKLMGTATRLMAICHMDVKWMSKTKANSK